ncbi:MAG: CpaF family protein [Alphaproteobacteria bacterium]|nr:CpaF family protein [Alphaproteobacteria bacterium]
MNARQSVTFGRRSAGEGDDDQPQSTGRAPGPAVQSVVDEGPVLTPSGLPSLPELRTLCLSRIDPAALAILPAEQLQGEVERILGEVADERRIQLNRREQRALASELTLDMIGLGPLEPLLADESVTDIMVNGFDSVYVERKGKLTLSGVKFRDNEHVANVARRIAGRIGRRIDESSPMVDARLADGSRVNIIFPPLALNGPCMSIRKFSKKAIDFQKLIQFGSIAPEVARALEIASRCRLNIIVSGGTGSGKTTMMNAMSRLIDHGERIITVEDAAELQLQQPHWVRLETRPANIEGKGEITARDLVRNALRMRPDRIIIGETRGAEAFDMLQAMNTGHDGSMSTVHANTPRDAVTRIENMVMMGAFSLPPKAIRTQIVGAVDLIVQVERQRDGGRRCTYVTEVVGLDGDVVMMNDLFHFEYKGEDSAGRIIGQYRASIARPRFISRLEYFGLDKAWMETVQNGRG